MSPATISAVVMTMLMSIAIAFLALAQQPVVGSDRWLTQLLEHVLTFGFLMLPAAAIRPNWLHWLWPVAAAYAGLLEWLQPAFERNGAFMHWFSSCFGIILVTFATWLVQGIIELVKARDAD